MKTKEIYVAKESNEFFGIKKGESYVQVGRSRNRNGETHANYKNIKTGEVSEMPEMALIFSCLKK